MELRGKGQIIHLNEWKYSKTKDSQTREKTKLEENNETEKYIVKCMGLKTIFDKLEENYYKKGFLMGKLEIKAIERKSII